MLGDEMRSKETDPINVLIFVAFLIGIIVGTAMIAIVDGLTGRYEIIQGDDSMKPEDVSKMTTVEIELNIQETRKMLRLLEAEYELKLALEEWD